MASDPIQLAQRSPEARAILGRIRGWALLWGMPIGLLLFAGLIAAGFFIHRMEYSPASGVTFIAADQLEVAWESERPVMLREEVTLVADSDTTTGTVVQIAPSALILQIKAGELSRPTSVQIGQSRNLHQILFGTIFPN